MRISDWSSDVCSSDLLVVGIIVEEGTGIQRKPPTHQHILGSDFEGIDELGLEGRAIINAGQLKNRENSVLFINGQKYGIQIASFSYLLLGCQSGRRRGHTACFVSSTVEGIKKRIVGELYLGRPVPDSAARKIGRA